jgi:hypothetical protein
MMWWSDITTLALHEVHTSKHIWVLLLTMCFRTLMSMHASILVDSVGPPSAEVCRTAASFP